MRIVESSNVKKVAALIGIGAESDARVERAVRRIVQDVRRRGDTALLAYARKFDGLRAPVEITRGQIEAAARQVPVETRKAVALAARAHSPALTRVK